MTVPVDAQALIAFLLALGRTGAWVAASPPFSSRAAVPLPAKAAVAAGLAFGAEPLVAAGKLPSTAPALLAALVSQVMIGLALGFVVQIVLSAVASAGILSDMLGGISLPTALDPLSGEQMSVFGQLYEQTALVLLFVTNGELLVVRGLFASFSGPGPDLARAGTLVSYLAGSLQTLFVAAVEVAGPLLLVLFAAQVVLAMLSRAAPQINVYFVGFPFQILLTILVAGLAVRSLGPAVEQLVAHAIGLMGRLASGG